jgi:cell shape-determining protein MreC
MSIIRVMLDFSRRKTLLISLAVSAAVLAVPAAMSARLRLAVSAVFEPLTGTARSIGMGVRKHLASFGRGTRLQRELEAEREARARAEARLAESLDELGRLKRAGTDSAAVRTVLDRAKWRGGVPVPANVIRRPGRWESFELFVDRGADQGVRKRQAVLAGDAALGVVAEVSPGTSRVLMLGHPELVVPVAILDAGASGPGLARVEARPQGLLVSAGERLEIKFVTRDQPVRAKFLVVTSGLDGAFPPGCLVGEVAAGVTAADEGPFHKICVDPARNLASPETVWILTGTDAGTERPGPPAGPGPTGKK